MVHATLFTFRIQSIVKGKFIVLKREKNVICKHESIIFLIYLCSVVDMTLRANVKMNTNSLDFDIFDLKNAIISNSI